MADVFEYGASHSVEFLGQLSNIQLSRKTRHCKVFCNHFHATSNISRSGIPSTSSENEFNFDIRI